MRFSRQDYWSELPFLSPEDLPDPGIEPVSPALQADSLPLCHLGSQLSMNDELPLYTLEINKRDQLHLCLVSETQSGLKSGSEVAQSCPTLCDPMDCGPPGSSIHGIFLGKSTGVGCYFLLQGIFPTQGSNLYLLHCRQTLYHLRHQGIPKLA